MAFNKDYLTFKRRLMLSTRVDKAEIVRWMEENWDSIPHMLAYEYGEVDLSSDLQRIEYQAFIRFEFAKSRRLVT